MPKIIVSDTSCLILLNKIGRILLLESLYRSITVTTTVATEFGKELPHFITIENPKDKTYQRLLERTLDSGEASTTALALEKKNCLLIIDETKGRKEANQLKLAFTGTVGILIIAKEKKLINSITEVFNQIGRTDFRISEALITEAKRRCDEL